MVLAKMLLDILGRLLTVEDLYIRVGEAARYTEAAWRGKACCVVEVEAM